MNRLPLIGITMGDPAGIGPEIIAMALGDGAIYRQCRPLVLGDPAVLSSTLSRLPATMGRNARLKVISEPNEASGAGGVIDVMAVSSLDPDEVQPGRPAVAGGKAMVSYIVQAVEMAQRGDIAAMVTCPISKALMHAAGYRFDGHTQLIAHLTHSADYVMMLAGERLRVVLVTIHCALRDVADHLNQEAVYRTLKITGKALKEDFGVARPCLAVAALNPHAGEDGLFGSEERDTIVPAMQMAQTEGLRVEGPFPADTLFHRALGGRFDAVVAMYHDQGLIPLKLLHFSDAVNVTLGLPIIRTSVDHGTAYDIAGTGQADPSSLKAAIGMAVSMAKSRGGI